MHLLRTFLKPGWLLATVLVVAFAAACFLILAPWQLGKNSETEHRNSLIHGAVSTPAVPLDELVPPGSTMPADDEWREVTMTGRYLTDKQALLRLRSVDDRPAVEVLTPFQITGSDRTILVDRGYLRPGADGSVSSPGAPAEQVTLHARLRKSESTSPGKEPRIEDGRLTAYTIDTAALGAAADVPLDTFYVQLTADQPGGLGPVTLPQLESGPYLSYGLQWLAFGIMAPLGIGYFVWAEVKHRRALKAANDGETPSDAPAASGRSAQRQRILDELAAAGTAEASTEPAGAAEVWPPSDRTPSNAPLREFTASDAETTHDDEVAARLARRYGR
ncbi:hypothetical protein C6V83_13260 [Gordonia iterans]|uniref:SURF1-like protein n=1 Tax=Gordonia iterans TaxID=1004901 RepID=A0A2S0KHC6_9ACTN|nr:SURF1 family cytochrome oxidase biogenesis protein [Gordonia iterans]AVM01080.1 hypothetical protein C6V83_13260 [Gordonia iterans]